MFFILHIVMILLFVGMQIIYKYVLLLPAQWKHSIAADGSVSMSLYITQHTQTYTQSLMFIPDTA